MSGTDNKLKEEIISINKNFVSVQPMTAPTGLIFYLDFKYKSTIIDTFESKAWKLYDMLGHYAGANNISDKILVIIRNKDYTRDNLMWMNDIYRKYRRKQ